MKIEIRPEPFDPWKELEAHQRSAFGRKGSYGATAAFVGTMRDFNEGDSVDAMTLEHYAGMTERHLQRIAEEANQRWLVDDILIVHRVGALKPGDPIVLVAVWSAHRSAAFDACRFIMEDLKSRAPFWKKEEVQDGTRWVEKNSPA
ncbi:MAG: molybdenum cofactor biosynthesis protein MoaE [Chromatiales bacterium]